MGYIQWIRNKLGHDLIFLNFAGAIVTNELDEILLQKRRDSNLWGFPGGTMELGESGSETAIREVYEECGIKIKIESLIGIYTKYFDEYSNGDKAQTITLFFHASFNEGELISENEESKEVKFFRMDSIPDLFNQQHADALIDFKNNLRGICR